MLEIFIESQLIFVTNTHYFSFGLSINSIYNSNNTTIFILFRYKAVYKWIVCMTLSPFYECGMLGAISKHFGLMKYTVKILNYTRIVIHKSLQLIKLPFHVSYFYGLQL